MRPGRGSVMIRSKYGSGVSDEEPMSPLQSITMSGTPSASKARASTTPDLAGSKVSVAVDPHSRCARPVVRGSIGAGMRGRTLPHGAVPGDSETMTAPGCQPRMAVRIIRKRRRLWLRCASPRVRLRQERASGLRRRQPRAWPRSKCRSPLRRGPPASPPFGTPVRTASRIARGRRCPIRDPAPDRGPSSRFLRSMRNAPAGCATEPACGPAGHRRPNPPGPTPSNTR